MHILQRSCPSPQSGVCLRHPHHPHTTTQAPEVHGSAKLPIISFSVIHFYGFKISCSIKPSNSEELAVDHGEPDTTPPTHHGDHGTPGPAARIVNFCRTELRGIVPATHSIDHVVEDGAAQMLPPGAHATDGGPLVSPGVKPLHSIERALTIGPH